MKTKHILIKGKTFFSLTFIVLTITLIVGYFTGLEFKQSLIENLFISLGILSITLFSFFLYGLYNGFRTVQNFPNFRDLKKYYKLRYKKLISLDNFVDFHLFPIGEGLTSTFMNVLLWLIASIFFIVLFSFLDTLFLLTLIAFLSFLYWVFYNALALVIIKSSSTIGNISRSVYYSLLYTILYSGWVYGIGYIISIIN